MRQRRVESFRRSIVMAGLVGLLLGVPLKVHAIDISACGSLTNANTTYVLQNDVVASGSCFVIGANNITLDLNGHTVTFGEGHGAILPNPGFESGTGMVPYDWDLTDATAVTRVVASKYFGAYELTGTIASGDQIIKSSVVTIPANVTFIGSAFVKGTPGTSATVTVKNADNGVVIAQKTLTDLGRGFGVVSPSFKFSEPTAVQLEIMLTGGGTYTVDQADIRPAYQYGIVASPYHHAVEHPDLPANLPVGGINLRIMNGVIRQGSGAGVHSSGVYYKGYSGNKGLTLDNVVVDVNGISTNPVYCAGADNYVINKLTATSSSPSVFNRMAVSALLKMDSPSRSITITNSRFEGGAQQGIGIYSTNDRYQDGDQILIDNNIIANHEKVTDGYGIMLRGLKNVTVSNNTIIPIFGRGIAIDTTGNEAKTATINAKIFNNYIEVKEKPNFEFGATGLESPAIRLRGYANSGIYNANIYSNTIKVFSGREYVNSASGIMATLLNPVYQGVNIYDNTIIAVTSDASRYAYALVFEGVSAGSGLKIYGNRLESNSRILRFGEQDFYDTAGIVLKGNTLVKGVNPLNFRTVHYGYWRGVERDNIFIDTTFEGGASMDDIYWDPAATDLSIIVGWSLKVKVVDLKGRGLEGVAVTATDIFGTAYKGTTDKGGFATFDLPAYRRDGVGGQTYKIFNEYIITAQYGTDTLGQNLYIENKKDVLFEMPVLGPIDTISPVISVATVDTTVINKPGVVTADATDNSEVVKVEFFVNNVPTAIDNVAPYVFTMAAPKETSETYVISARAVDGFGNVGYSENVSINIINDNTAPTVTIVEPLAGSQISGSVHISANAFDKNGVTKAELYVNDILMTTDTEMPFTFTLDTTVFGNGEYVLFVKAYDVAGNIGGTGQVPVSFFNDLISPNISIKTPTATTSVAGFVPITATASDNVGVAKVDILVNGEVKATLTASPYVYTWDTTKGSNGTYAVAAKAYDAAGNYAQTTNLSVTVANDTTAPTVAISSTFASYVLGTQSVAATASDNVGIVKVEFFVNGVLKATDTSAPYGFSWDTKVYADATYTLTAKAYDAAGNVTVSAPVLVRVYNSGPVVKISSPTSGTKYRKSTTRVAGLVATLETSSVVTITVDAASEPGVEKVEVFADGHLVGTTSAAPYKVQWDTTGVNGAKLLTAKAYDMAGNVAESEKIEIIVATDVVNPTVKISSPAKGKTVTGIVTVKAAVKDASGIAKVELYVNGTLLETRSAAPFNFAWDTAGYDQGKEHTLRVVAFDKVGNFAEATTVVKVKDTVSPVVNLATPVLSGDVLAISASATDNAGVTKMRVYVDGKMKIQADGDSVSYAWPVATAKTGKHTVAVIAYDAAGRATSQPWVWEK